VSPIVGRAEKLPMAAGAFDAVLATGLLEYTNRRVALSEISRVVRPGGRVILTMLNPLSPYRLFEWNLYWPFLRRLGNVEAMFGILPHKRHGAVVSGIQATPAFRLAREMRSVGLQPYDVIHYDLNAFVPPADRFVRQSDRGWRDHPEKTVSRGMGRWLCTGYLIAARAGERVSVPAQRRKSRAPARATV
jgi:SAM-dependent methyltransferase